jgi:hypothetical protein
MGVINAFIGHSFTPEDEAVVRKILDFLSSLQKTLPGFRWAHAEAAEPKELSAKVVPMMREADVFIAICTKKEQVVVSERWIFFPKTQWKTSDWIIQEIGLAVGMGHPLVLLVEEGLRLPGGLQGNINYISFSRDKLEGAFKGLMEMLSSLSPKESSSLAVSAPPPPLEEKAKEEPKEEAKAEHEEDLKPRDVARRG